MARADNGFAVRYFLVRVVLVQRGPRTGKPVRFADMDPATRVAVHMALEAGDLCKLPDGCIAEGVKEFRNEDDAHYHHAQHVASYPGEDFRVILTSAQPLL